MSKYIYGSLALGLIVLATSVRADEVTRSTSTRVENPDSSSSRSSTLTTTTEDNPTTVNQESTTTQTTTKKAVVPKRQKTVVRHTETDVTR